MQQNFMWILSKKIKLEQIHQLNITVKKYCILPFVSVRSEGTFGEDSMGFKPCCLYKSDQTLRFETIESYLESDFLKNLQQHFLTQDQLPPGCERCSRAEDHKQISARQQKNKFFDSQILTQTNILEIDMMVGNLCNLSCIMCNPTYSSQLAAEEKKLGKIVNINYFNDIQKLLELLKKFPNLEHLALTGGEFFYLKNKDTALEKIAENQNIKLKITTNGTSIDSSTIEKLKKIPNLSLRISIDGTEDAYDMIRYPAKWKDLSQQIVDYKKHLPHAQIESVMTFQPLNVCSVFKWLDYLKVNQIESHFIDMIAPTELTWAILTDQEKMAVQDFISKNLLLIKDKLTSKENLFLLNFAKNALWNYNYDHELREKGIQKLRAKFKLRKIDVSNYNNLDLFPELKKALILSNVS